MNVSSRNIQRYCLSVVLIFVFLGCFGCEEKSTEEKPAEVAADTSVTSRPLFVDANAGKTWNIFGLQIVGKIMSAQTGGQYAVVMSTTPPDGGPPLHVHQNEDELFYVLEGRYEFRCGEQTVEVSKGALVHLPRKMPHGFRNVGDQPGILINTITPGGFEEFFEEIDQLPKDAPLDRNRVETIAARYGLTFLPQN